MLILFSVANYRSFYEEQEMSLVASPAVGRRMETAVPAEVDRRLIYKNLPGLSGRHYLRAAGIYGANGSGKSNFIHAMATMRAIVLHSGGMGPEGKLPYDPFLLNDDASQLPTSFFAAFEWGGTRYEYEFEYLATRIVSEELSSFPKGKRRLLFSRETTASLETSVKTGRDIKLDAAIVPLINANVLVLSFLRDHPAIKGVDVARPAAAFFSDGLVVLDRVRDRWASFPHSGRVLDGASGTDFQREMIQKIIRDSDVGITDAQVETKILPEDAEGDALHQGGGQHGVGDERPQRKVKTVVFNHASTTGGGKLSLIDESLGTNQMFSLSSYIAAAIESGATLAVDELDASLHPLLFEEIVGMFEREDASASPAQLVFTAHETIPMARGLLLQDQIWLSEKDDEGSTTLTPLSDYMVDEDENMALGYLTGRYKGVPILPRDYGVVAGGEG